MDSKYLRYILVEEWVTQILQTMLGDIETKPQRRRLRFVVL